MAFTPELIQQIYGGRVVEADLLHPYNHQHGGYTHGGIAGSAHGSDENWWAPNGWIYYSPDPQHGSRAEFEYARQHFFLPCRILDSFGAFTIAYYDQYDLLVQETKDALDNKVTAGERNVQDEIVSSSLDYRVLQPTLMTDPNRNRTAVAFDALGMVVGTAVMGKVGENKGDLIDATFLPDLDDSTVSAHINQPLIDPYDILQKATTRLVYDLFAYQHTKDDPQPQPAVVYTLARETHHFDLAPGAQTKVQHSFSYSDGFGREIQKKIQAEPGPAPQRDHAGKVITNAAGQPEMTTHDVTPRWVGSGWTIFNNKGKPVRQYEPFFTDTHRFEFDAQIGVSPVLFYDPVERVVATLHPNHTYEKVVFDPWQQRTWDVNDTIQGPAAPGDPPFDPKDDPDVGQYFGRLASDAYLPTWYDCRTDEAKALVAWPDHDEQGKPLPANARHRALERRAAEKAAAHAATPTVAHFDTLGRPFLTLADNGPDLTDPGHHLYFATRVELDIEGNQRAVIDANGRVVMRYDYDMLGNRIHQASMEAGERWTLNDVTGQPIRGWDSRGHSFTTTYDALRRPLGQTVRGTIAESDSRTRNRDILVDQIEYGEGIANAEALNLRTRVYRHRDSAGVATNARLDANGNPTAAYDFKGNLLHSTRHLVSDYKAIPD